MTHRGPFQPLPFCGSVILCRESYPSFDIIHVKSSLQASQAELSIYVSSMLVKS